MIRNNSYLNERVGSIMQCKSLRPSLEDRLYDVIGDTGGFDCYDEIIRVLHEYAEARLIEYIEHKSTSNLNLSETRDFIAYVDLLKNCLDATRKFQDVID